MRNYYIDHEKSEFRNSLMREFTRANIITLFFWAGTGFYQGRFDIFLWLKIFATLLSIFIAGLIADWLWFWLFSGKFSRPFSFAVYASRLPLYVFITAAIAFPASQSVNIFGSSWLWTLVYCIMLQLFYQCINQWIIFNRLRKLSLIEL